jgi:4-hydroxy-tetrahydrodipicolinate synthase
MNPPAKFAIWSAVPTPLTADLKVDETSVERLVEAAVREGVEGFFIAGTCGEGPWLPDRERVRLMKAAVAASAGRLRIAAQVSDNSVPRILANAEVAAAAGVDVAVIAPPAVFLNATPDRVAALFIEAATASPLPVGIYDQGRHRPIMIPTERLQEIYLLPKVELVKDSSGMPERRAAALSARREKPGLRLFNGDEFKCIEYADSGYEGAMFGGAAAVAPEVRRIADLLAAGRRPEAVALEAGMRRKLFGIYGGESIACWLTGLKYYLVRRGIFTSDASFLGYPLHDECRAFIERTVAEESAAAPPAHARATACA